MSQPPGLWLMHRDLPAVGERVPACLLGGIPSGTIEPVPAHTCEGEAPGDGMPGGRPMHTDVAMDRLQAGLEGRYTIKRQLGRGGMATVYLAFDVKHQRQVALKLLHPEFAAVVGPERFLREIDIAAALSNPHILPLYDSGQVDGLLYYVMPYVAGESLENRLHRETQLPIDTALAITKDIATGLTYAHDLGLVHRDIKPGNILLDGDSAVLADFGIARAVDVVAGEELTDSGIVVGTAEYMSPEQGQGHGKVDSRSDIYSLACVLYEMIAGEPPFDGPTAQVIMARHQHEAPRSLTVTRSTVPASVACAIENALAKVPADRPKTAERFVEMLDEPVPVTGSQRRRYAALASALLRRLRHLNFRH